MFSVPVAGTHGRTQRSERVPLFARVWEMGSFCPRAMERTDQCAFQQRPWTTTTLKERDRFSSGGLQRQDDAHGVTNHRVVSGLLHDHATACDDAPQALGEVPNGEVK